MKPATPPAPQHAPTAAPTRQSALDHARLALAANLLDTALDHVKLALSHDPRCGEARLLEARIRLRRHEPRLALHALDTEASTPLDQASAPQRPDIALLRATALAAAGRLEHAIDAATELAVTYPDDLHVLRALAGMQVHARQHQAAAQTLAEVARLDPADRGAARLRSDLLAQASPDDALDALGQVDPSNRHRAARLCVASQRWAEAEHHYRQLLENAETRDTVDPELQREAAEVAQELGDDHRALDRLHAYLQETSPDAVAWGPACLQAARLHLHLGQLPRAGRWFFRATPTAEAAPAWAGLLAVAQRSGRERLARLADARLRPLVDRAGRRRLVAQVQPHLPPTLDPTPAAERSPLQQMLAESASVMHRAADRFPDRADVHFHRAVCDAARGEVADAGNALDLALMINPRYAAAQAKAQTLVGIGADHHDQDPDDFITPLD